MRHRLHRLSAIAVLAAGVTVFATVPAQAATAPGLAAQAPAGQGDFYTPPAVLPPNNGDVIKSEPSKVYLDPVLHTTWPATSSRIMYRSTDTHGAPIAITGTVLVPTAPWKGPGERPLVSFAAGTQGQGNQCAPSILFTQGLEYESLFITQYIGAGDAVVITDYQGLGTPGVHQYVNRLAEAHAVLDAARAAQKFGNGVPANGPVGIIGYSQGGGASAAAAELQASYAPELNVVGSASGAPVADLAVVANRIDGTTLTGAIGYTINGLLDAYPEVAGLRGLLNKGGEQMLTAVRTQCLAETTLAFGLHLTSEYTVDHKPVSSFLGVEPYKSVVDQQRIGRLKPAAPAYIWSNRTDDIVPYSQARQLAVDWCGQGANVQFNALNLWAPFPGSGSGHLEGEAFGAGSAAAWLNARFTAPGVTPPSQCGSLPSA